MRLILSCVCAALAAASLTASVSMCLTDAIRHNNKQLIDQLFEAKNDINQAEAELIALRDSVTCDGTPVQSIDQVGRILVLRGENILAMRQLAP